LRTDQSSDFDASLTQHLLAVAALAFFTAQRVSSMRSFNGAVQAETKITLSVR
jgi:hypothetical protein